MISSPLRSLSARLLCATWLGLGGLAWGEEPDREARALLDRIAAIDWDSRAVSEEKDLSDDAWKTRIEVEHGLLALGKTGVATLIGACQDENPHVRALAASCLGCLDDPTAIPALRSMAQGDSHPPAQVLALEALGRLGAAAPEDWIEDLAAAEDAVGRAASWALARSKEGEGIGSSLRESAMATYDPSGIATARIGQPAPDFDLDNRDGNRVRLSDYRGKSAVVLVFMLSDG